MEGAPALRAVSTTRSETELIRLVRDGDRGAAEELVELTYSSVFASLYRMCRDSDLAADLTQETYRKAWESFGEFDGRARFFTWLYRIAYTTFLNHVRRPARVVAFGEKEPNDVRDPAPTAEEIVTSDDETRRLREAVMKLPEDVSFTVTAHYWGELPVREIAEIAGITTVGVRKRLDRAYRMLQPLLEGKPNV